MIKLNIKFYIRDLREVKNFSIEKITQTNNLSNKSVFKILLENFKEDTIEKDSEYTIGQVSRIQV